MGEQRGDLGGKAARSHTRFAVLLGDPVGHSRSPLIHNTAFRALGLDAVYLACRVAPSKLPAAVAGLPALGALGANVTVPHKEAVIPLVDRLSPTAEAVGAVNTLVFSPEGSIEGDNTDVAGFLAPLRPYAERLRGAEMVVLGAGGAARATVYGLLTAHAPARLTVAARRPGQAEALTAAFAPHDTFGVLQTVSLSDAADAVRSAKLIVNATSAGMAPHAEATPWPHTADFHEGHLVYDLVYAPTETRLLREAAIAGAETLGGLPMLLGQAAAAFERWTGEPMPLDAVRAALASTTL